MRNFRKLNSGLGLAIIALGALTVAGCGASDAEQKSASAEQSEEGHGEEGGGHIEMTAAERSAKGIKSIALGKRQLTSAFIEPGEVTGTALWLCSDAARGINGQAIAIAGGAP